MGPEDQKEPLIRLTGGRLTFGENRKLGNLFIFAPLLRNKGKPASDFLAALNHMPRQATFYHQVIFNTLLNCQQRIRDLISLDAKTYYRQLQENKPLLLQNMAQQDMVSYLGIEPQSLSRLRKPGK